MADATRAEMNAFKRANECRFRGSAHLLCDGTLLELGHAAETLGCESCVRAMCMQSALQATYFALRSALDRTPTGGEDSRIRNNYGGMHGRDKNHR
jgi:hypothetical protein